MAKLKRKTSRDWMKNPRFEYECNDLTVNIMLAVQTMCKSTGWNSDRLKPLWNRTALVGRGKLVTSNISYVNFTRSKKNIAYGNCRSLNLNCFDHGDKKVSVTGANTDLADTLVTILHELCHVVQGNPPKVNGVDRYHDLAFNMQQYKMARRWWGYSVHPLDAGWSIGKGYAPTKHLVEWLQVRIENQDPKVMSWLNKIVF